jgi:hypothetical protein
LDLDLPVLTPRRRAMRAAMAATAITAISEPTTISVV